MIMYDFNHGSVVLGIRGGKYYISRDGNEQSRNLSEEQASNPMLAITEYTAAIHEYLRGRAKAYLQADNGNAIMGCKHNISCLDCPYRGAKGSRCQFKIEKEEML